MKGIALGFLMMALASASSVEAQVKTRALSGAERVLVESIMKERLVDPDSARFEIKPFIEGSGLVCGRFNSKNRMGGYTGYDPFEVQVATDTRGTIISVQLAKHYTWGDARSSAIIATANCRKAGYDIPDPRPWFN